MTDTETPPAVFPTPPGSAPRTVLPLPRREEDAEKKEDTRLRLADEEEQTKASRETLQVLAAAQAALIKLISGVFSAVGKIVGALLDLVEAIGGRRAAKAADHAAAEFLDHVIPGDQRSPTVPTTPVPPVPQPPTSEMPKPEAPQSEMPKPEASKPEAPQSETPATPRTEAPDAPTAPTPVVTEPAGTALDIRVRLLLETYAASDEERARITPTFVSLVALGVEFMVGVEALAPGSVRALRASAPTAETLPGTPPGVTSEPAPAPGTTPKTPSGDGATVPLPEASVSEAPVL